MISSPLLDASANFSAHVLQPAARSLACACFAGLALAAFRVRHLALRLNIWRAVLLVALTMPLLSLLLPPFPVYVPLAAKLVRAQPSAEIARPYELNSRAIIVNQVAHSIAAKSGAFSDGLKSSHPTDAAEAPSATSAAPLAPGKDMSESVWPANVCCRSTMNQPATDAISATIVPASSALTMNG